MGSQVATHSAVQTVRGPTSPSRQTRRADMSRAAFVGLVAGWSGAVMAIFAFSTFIRLVS
jgi:hypothetical protein